MLKKSSSSSHIVTSYGEWRNSFLSPTDKYIVCEDESPQRSLSFCKANDGDFVTSSAEGPKSVPKQSNIVASTNVSDVKLNHRTVNVVYEQPGPLYLDLRSRPQGFGAVIKSFRRKPDGSCGQAEASGLVGVDDLLLTINGKDVTELQFQNIIDLAKTGEFPLTLTFLPCLHHDANGETNMSSQLSPSNRWSEIGSRFNQIVDQHRRKSATNIKIFSQSNGSRNETSNRNSVSSSDFSRKLNLSNDDANSNGGSKLLNQWKDSESMKNLWKMMGRKNSEDERSEISTIISNVVLSQKNAYHSNPIQVLSGSNFLGGRDSIIPVDLAWYRETAQHDIMYIRDVRDGLYYPSADDIGCKLSVQCQSAQYSDIFKLVETGPILLESQIKDTVRVLSEAGCGSFSATLLSYELDSFQIRIDQHKLSLLKVSEDESECGIVAESEYHQFEQIHLDPRNPLMFTLQFRESGWTLGNPGDKCVLKVTNTRSSNNNSSIMDFKTLCRVHLLAQSRANRDIIALLLRKFRALKVFENDSDSAGISENISHTTAKMNDEDSVALGMESISDNKAVYFQPEHSAENNNLVSTDEEDEDEDNNDDKVSLVVVDEDTSKTTILLKEKDLKSAELQEKIKSLTHILKATKNERNLLSTAVEVRDQRLEASRDRIRELEDKLDKMTQHCNSLDKVKEINLKLEEKMQRINCALTETDQVKIKLTEHFKAEQAKVEDLERRLEEREKQLRYVKSEIVGFQQDRIIAINAKNELQMKHQAMLKKFGRLVQNGRSVEEVERQLSERVELKIELSVSNATLKETQDELDEYKDTLRILKKQNSLGDPAVHAIVKQNIEFKRLIDKLTTSLRNAEMDLDRFRAATPGT